MQRKTFDGIQKRMFTNQKVLGIILIVFIVGTVAYFTVTKFKQEVTSISASPSPSPSAIDFVFGKTPVPAAQQQGQVAELPLLNNKQLNQFPGTLKPEDLENKKAIIQTTKGMIQLQIYPEATMAASNFIILAANGYYHGLTLHRVEDWVVQGGDPTGTGSGGPGYQFPDEPVNRQYVKGAVAMANSGPDTNGSQFFILKKDTPLPPKYTIFGQVISGQNVVDKLTKDDVMQQITIENLQ